MVKGAVTSTTSRSLPPSFEPEMHGEMLTHSREQLSPDGRKGWWNADLEGWKVKAFGEMCSYQYGKWIQESGQEC